MRTLKTLPVIAALAVAGLPTAAVAKNGADDPAGHVRHGSHARHHAKRHARHRADDGVNHARHGADDGPNHT